MRELRLLDEEHVLRAVAGEVVGDGGSDRPATNNQDMDMPVSPESHDVVYPRMRMFAGS
jgi:hypothetical protein